MSQKITIDSVIKEPVIVEGCDKLKVIVTIKDGDETHERIFHYGLDASEKDIKAELKKVLFAFLDDKEIAKRSKKIDEDNKKAEITKKALEGAEITLSEEEPK